MASDLELVLDGEFPFDGSAPIWMEMTALSPVKHDSLVWDDTILLRIRDDRAQIVHSWVAMIYQICTHLRRSYSVT